MGVQINGSEGNVIATKGTYSGNVTIGGTLTYEDVTNIDSVGLVTARTGIEIGARPGVAASISVDGNAIFSGISTFSNTTESSASTNGSVQFDGGVGIVKNLNVGGDLAVTSTLAKITLTDSDSGDAYQLRNDTGSFIVRNATDSRSDITVDGDGKVGISTEAPTHNLDVHSSGNPYLKLLRSGYNPVYIGNAAGEGVIETTGATFIKTGGSERLRITSGGKVLIGDDTAENTIGLNANVQTFGTDASTSGVAIRRGSNDAQAAFLVMSKSRNASVGSRTIVNNGDEIGNIFFAADDGTDLVSNTAAIKSQVDGAPGANDTPGNLSFWTTPDGSNTATQKVTISNAGLMTVTKQYFLLVDLSSDISGYNATGTTHILFNRIQQENKDASLSSCFDTSTGLFTAPVAGLYFLEAAVYSTTASFGQSWFVVSGARKSYTDEVMTGGSGFTHNHTILRLAANETVGYLAYSSSGSSVNIRSNANHTYMKIALIC